MKLAVEIEQNQPKQNQLNLVSSMQNLAAVYSALWKHRKAADILKECLDIIKDEQINEIQNS